MLAIAAVEFFKYQIVSNIIVLACWSPVDQVKYIRQLSQHGKRGIFSCDPNILELVDVNRLQGVIYIDDQHNLLEKVKPEHFAGLYKWLIISTDLPDVLNKVRYDSNIVFQKKVEVNKSLDTSVQNIEPSYFYDVYVHPQEGASAHPLGILTVSGLHLTHEREKILRRFNLKMYPLKIATPTGHYSAERYDGKFIDYLEDESILDQDPGIRIGYSTSMLLLEAVNASDILIENELWANLVNNNSMYFMLAQGTADLAGGILRILLNRIKNLDYIVPIWPFSVGFTYLAERKSSSNMYLEPFSGGVWWSCLATLGVLALVQRATSKSKQEKDGALCTVLSSWLQQDASAVPEGTSGRWAFIVLSVSSMLVHAYYTSAIVSALMSTGRGGPDTLRALADSKYMIASEDYDYLRYLFFDVETNWKDLEYLKKKKMSTKFYQELQKGVELISQGNTAFINEYNQIYPHLKSFSDDQICQLQHVDLIPESLSWVTATKRGQWTSTLRPAGAWLHETGLAKRLVSRLRIRKPPCRASLLAERVKFGDVAPLIALTAFGTITSLILLGFEILFAKWRRSKKSREEVRGAVVARVTFEDDIENYEYEE